MDLTNLRYFLVAVKEQNITKAADKLYISRQALSKTIKRLEEQVGTPLIIPSAQGIQPTEKGEVICEAAQQILSIWDDAICRLELSKPNVTTLHVGYGQNSYNLWTRDHVRGYMERWPQTELNVQSMLPDQLLEGLRNGQLDLVISNVRPKGSEFSCIPIVQRPTYALMHRQNKLAWKNVITPQDLHEHDVCFIPYDQTGIDNFSQLMEGYNLTYHPMVSPDPTISTLCNELMFHGSVFITSAIFRETVQQQDFLLKPFDTGLPHSFYNMDVNAVVLRTEASDPEIFRYVEYLKANVKEEFRNMIVE